MDFYFDVYIILFLYQRVYYIFKGNPNRNSFDLLNIVVYFLIIARYLSSYLHILVVRFQSLIAYFLLNLDELAPVQCAMREQ